MIQQHFTRSRPVFETGAKLVRAEAIPARLLLLRTGRDAAVSYSFSSEDRPQKEEEEGRDSLDEAARDEREYVRRRLLNDLGREPSEEELDEWLRRHTEGY